MKKVYELSVLCQMDINVSFYEPQKRRLVEYTTNADVTTKTLNQLIEQAGAKSGRRGGQKLIHKIITSQDFADGQSNIQVDPFSNDQEQSQQQPDECDEFQKYCSDSDEVVSENFTSKNEQAKNKLDMKKLVHRRVKTQDIQIEQPQQAPAYPSDMAFYLQLKS